jgi:hypothetical protein
VAAAAVFPALDLSGQLAAARAPASAEAFFTPLSRALAQERLAHPESNGQRLEVVDPRGHWATVYLADEQLARGWERQVDRDLNPLFYGGARLDAASYRAWLDGLAVGWVALPSGPLDYAAVAEAALVRHGLAYLQPVWASRDWTLYRVLDPAPLVTGATVLAVDDEAVVVSVARAGRVHLAVRWSPYLVVTDEAGGPDGVVARDAGGQTVATLDRPGTYRVTADFDGTLLRTLGSWARAAGRGGARG